MTEGAAADWDRSGAHIAVPIAGHDLHEVRVPLAENCEGDHLIALGERVLFERRKNAALPVVIFC